MNLKRIGGSLVLFCACSGGVAEKHWQLAETFSSQGQHLRAIEEYSRVVNFGGRSPISAKAQLAIAQTYENHLRDYIRAIRAYRDVLKRSDDAPLRLQAQWAIAKIYAQPLENPSSAAEEYRLLYRDLGRSDRRGPEILLDWAQALLDAGRPQDAAGLFLEFRESYPGHKDGPRALLEEAKAWLADRRTDRAIALFQETITKFAGFSTYDTLVGEAYYGLGLSFETNGDLGKALEAYRHSLAQYPNLKVIELKIEGLVKRQKEKRI